MAERPAAVGRQFGGVLIEGEGSEEEGAVAIGIGVNCAAHPADAAFPATDLAAGGASVSAAALFACPSRSRCRAARAMEPRQRLCDDPRRLARTRGRSR